MRSWPGPFHRRERLARFRALLAVATLLIALVPGPHANAQTGAVPLDLPAMSLRRTDLDELGLVGFEHRSSAAIWPQDYLETQGGADPELQVLLSSLLIDGGAVRRYSMVFERTDATGGVTSRIEPYLVQFAHPSGAKAWYDFKANESPSGNAADVPGVQAYGDASELTASSGPSSRPPGKYAQLDFTVSLGSIYAGVQYANFADVDQAVTAPGTAEIEALMDRLVARIDGLMDVADPGLSNATLSFAGSGSWLDRLPPLIATYSHTYSFIDGAYQPFPGDTAVSIAEKERYYSSSGTVREFHQFSGFGTVNPVPPSVDIWITELASTDAAETRLAASLDLSPNYHDKVEITGYDDLGDGMVFFAYTYDVSSAVTLSGYRIDVRMGKVVFRLGVDAVTPFGPDVAYELASAQVECLRMGHCPGPYEFPIAAFSGG